MTPSPSGAGDTAPAGRVPALQFFALALAGFCSMAALRVCDTLLGPLAQTFSASPAQVAVTISGFAMAYGCMQLVYGPAAERWGRLRVVMLVVAGCAVSTLWSGLSGSLDSLIASRIVSGALAAGIVPVTLVWVGDNTPYELRQATLARLLSATIAGLIAGQWLGGIIADLWHWRANFFLLFGLFGATAALLAYSMFVQPEARRSTPFGLRQYVSTARLLLTQRWACTIYVVAFLEGAFVFGALAFMPLHLQTHHGTTVGVSGTLVALFGIGGLLYSRSASRLLRRFREYQLVGIGGASLLISLLFSAVLPHPAWAVVACGLFGFGFYSLHGTLQANATQISAQHRAIAVTLYVGLLFLGQSVGVSAASWLIALTSTPTLFICCGLGLALLSSFFAHQLRARAASTRK